MAPSQQKRVNWCASQCHPPPPHSLSISSRLPPPLHPKTSIEHTHVPLTLLQSPKHTRDLLSHTHSAPFHPSLHPSRPDAPRGSKLFINILLPPTEVVVTLGRAASPRENGMVRVLPGLLFYTLSPDALHTLGEEGYAWESGRNGWARYVPARSYP